MLKMHLRIWTIYGYVGTEVSVNVIIDEIMFDLPQVYMSANFIKF